MADLPPVHFLSHGTTMLLGEDSRVRDYWRKIGQDALNHGIKGVILMGAHWWVDDNKIKIGMNPTPSVMPVSNVHPKHWRDYKPNPDLETGRRCVGMLRGAGFEVEEDPNRTWMIDVFPILVAMFPNGCPPVTVVSLNSHFDPFDHARMGTVLRPLREEGYLFIGSGGGVHNLYRTEWKYMNKYKDNFAMERPPDRENIEFRTALEDVIVKNGGGPKLRRGLARLMKHPYFRDAHGTDEHYIPALFIAGAIGEPEDEGAEGLLGAELWELRNQGETQFTIGKWTKGKYYGGWKKATAITA
ncbi:putative aromatic ring-opening dioxygenase family protein [Fusarium keratoplasticum]|uniref:Aromatic ring-opening dioxygenase family protein n=1 Tax=Fusarium keratoplasticum TaxID=1328300 RepID=A0ACC0R3Q8_9HYPO|nr:putative aromatic ring-opening dioxygenase family protein [Fusarium keratoplasticum]KAI8671844.1 putative aromatic ring-opening dioxygenase family protein [Fusarium keratoplasticum]KAI8679061.1 putative aromatic ring-opening dioxygenase family protein [Fusarium keratoplasticum]